MLRDWAEVLDFAFLDEILYRSLDIIAIVAISNTESALIFTPLPDVHDKTQTQIRMLAALAVKIMAFGSAGRRLCLGA